MKKVIIALAVTGFALTGCAKATEPFKDAPRSGVNDGPAETGTMPDGFNNWASKCDGPNRVYTLFHSDSAYGGIAVVKDDPRCPGAIRPAPTISP